MFKKVIGYFLQGLLYTIPVGATLYVFVRIFFVLDSILELPYPGVGILIIFVGITAIGVLGSFLIQLPVFNYFEKQIDKAPLVKLVYSSIKDLMKAFVGKKRSFNHPVMVKLYENSEIKRLGFITDESSDLLKKQSGLVTVYLPHSFAISGQLYLVPRNYVEEVDAKSADVMKYIIAGGVSKVE